MSSGVPVVRWIWVAMALGFGLWMLVWPDHYWKTWKSNLKGGDPFETIFPGRTAALKRYIERPHAHRRARIMGALFVGAAMLAVLLLVRGMQSGR